MTRISFLVAAEFSLPIIPRRSGQCSGLPLILVDHGQFDEVRLAAGRIDLRGQGVAALLVAARDEHNRALFREQPGGRTTQPP